MVHILILKWQIFIYMDIAWTNQMHYLCMQKWCHHDSREGRFHGFYFSVSSVDCGWLIHSTETSPPYELELTPTKGLLVWRCFHFREQLMLLLFLLKTNWPLCRQWLDYCLLNTSCVQSLWWDLCSITVIGAASPLKSFISFEVQQLHRGRFSYAHYNVRGSAKLRSLCGDRRAFWFQSL